MDFGDGVTAEVLSPPAEVFYGTSGDINENSLVLRFVYGKREFLFTADAGFDAERRMLASRLDLRADVLKVGHHGSKGSTSWEFLKAVRPEIAVISCGYKNPYGHPHKDTIKRLRDVGARIYRTDWDGAVTIKTDGRSLSVEAYKRRRSAAEGLPIPWGAGHFRSQAPHYSIKELPQRVCRLLGAAQPVLDRAG
jgi:competence protein ComEC